VIALDWGLSALRAFRLAPDGAVLGQRSTADGVLTIAPGGFATILAAVLNDWQGDRPIVAAGMVGSRQGWVEAPYAPCPAGAAELAAALTRVAAADLGDVWLVPGVSWSDGGADAPGGGGGRIDVMRGEEAQIVGALAARGIGDAVLCLPGTHAKWATVAGGRIVGFRTAMTGEVFAVLRQHSILGRLMRDDVDDDIAFDRGLARAAEPGGLLHHLFSARTAGLFERIAAPSLASYLSGLLIGDEIANLAGAAPADAPILLVGAPALTRRYARALARRGRASVSLPESVGAHGIHAIARAAGLL
jgi:2-dehydro-3-deoxygalactonokinase